MRAALLEALPVERAVRVGVGEQRAQPAPLKVTQFTGREELRALELALVAPLRELAPAPQGQRHENVANEVWIERHVLFPHPCPTGASARRAIPSAGRASDRSMNSLCHRS